MIFIFKRFVKFSSPSIDIVTANDRYEEDSPDGLSHFSQNWFMGQPARGDSKEPRIDF